MSALLYTCVTCMGKSTHLKPTFPFCDFISVTLPQRSSLRSLERLQLLSLIQHWLWFFHVFYVLSMFYALIFMCMFYALGTGLQPHPGELTFSPVSPLCSRCAGWSFSRLRVLGSAPCCSSKRMSSSWWGLPCRPAAMWRAVWPWACERGGIRTERELENRIRFKN